MVKFLNSFNGVGAIFPGPIMVAANTEHKYLRQACSVSCGYCVLYEWKLTMLAEGVHFAQMS